MKPDAEIRTTIDWRKLGAAHTGSPRTNPINAQQAALAVAKAGLTGGVKGALVLDGTFDVTMLFPGWGAGGFATFTKNTAMSFLDTSYFNYDAISNTVIILKPCFYMVIGDGHIILDNGVPGSLVSFNLSMPINYAGGGSISATGTNGIDLDTSDIYANCGPLMTNGALNDYVLVAASTHTLVAGSTDTPVGTGGVCRLQFMVVG
jgi:hypothetical protein